MGWRERWRRASGASEPPGEASEPTPVEPAAARPDAGPTPLRGDWARVAPLRVAGAAPAPLIGAPLFGVPDLAATRPLIALAHPAGPAAVAVAAPVPAPTSPLPVGPPVRSAELAGESPALAAAIDRLDAAVAGVPTRRLAPRPLGAGARPVLDRVSAAQPGLEVAERADPDGPDAGAAEAPVEDDDFFDPIAAWLMAEGIKPPPAGPEPERVWRHTLAQSRRMGLGVALGRPGDAIVPDGPADTVPGESAPAPGPGAAATAATHRAGLPADVSGAATVARSEAVPPAEPTAGDVYPPRAAPATQRPAARERTGSHPAAADAAARPPGAVGTEPARGKAAPEERSRAEPVRAETAWVETTRAPASEPPADPDAAGDPGGLLPAAGPDDLPQALPSDGQAADPRADGRSAHEPTPPATPAVGSARLVEIGAGDPGIVAAAAFPGPFSSDGASDSVAAGIGVRREPSPPSPHDRVPVPPSFPPTPPWTAPPAASPLPSPTPGGATAADVPSIALGGSIRTPASPAPSTAAQGAPAHGRERPDALLGFRARLDPDRLGEPAAVAPAAVNAFARMTGVDLGFVPLHRGPEVTAAARAAGARAFTRTGAVHLPGEDEAPLSTELEALLAHELTHVAQQRVLGAAAAEAGEFGAALEAQAVAVERGALAGVLDPLPPMDQPDPFAGVEAGTLSWTPDAGFLPVGMGTATSALAPQHAPSASPSPITFGPPSAEVPESEGRSGVRRSDEQDLRRDPVEEQRGGAGEGGVATGLAALTRRVDELAAKLAKPAVAGGGAKPDLDALAASLCDRVSTRIRADLVVERERAGRLYEFR